MHQNFKNEYVLLVDPRYDFDEIVEYIKTYKKETSLEVQNWLDQIKL